MNFLKALGLTTAFFAFVGVAVGIFLAIVRIFGRWSPLVVLFLMLLLLFWIAVRDIRG